MLSRITEVGWGVAVGVSVVWIVARLETALRCPDAAAPG
jgi:hypothetical protein